MKPDEGLSHFNVYRGTIPEDSLHLLNRLPIPAATLSFVDTTVIYGPDYVYRVTAVDSGGNESKRSVSVMARPGDATPPPSPMMVLVTPRGKFTELSWTKPRARDLKGYYVFRGSQATDLIRIVRTHLHADSTRYLDRGDGPDGLPPGESYVYGVCAIDNAHNESNMVLAAFRTPDLSPPAPPNDFRVRPTAGGDIQLLWQPSTSLDVASYTVYRGEDTLSLLRLATVKGHAFRDSSAVPEARYIYRITSLDSSKNESTPTPVETAIARPLHRRERPNK
jgi:fibronectin type 3 domain-containing protein